jgi:hypothetical protein
VTGVLDHVLVGLALFAAFGYAGYALGPRALRRRVARAIAATLARAPARVGLRGTAQRLAASAEQARGACGGCDNCGSTAAAAGAASASVASAAPLTAPPGSTLASGSAKASGSANSSEVKIAVSAIGWRQRTPL